MTCARYCFELGLRAWVWSNRLFIRFQFRWQIPGFQADWKVKLESNLAISVCQYIWSLKEISRLGTRYFLQLHSKHFVRKVLKKAISHDSKYSKFCITQTAGDQKKCSSYTEFRVRRFFSNGEAKGKSGRVVRVNSSNNCLSYAEFTVRCFDDRIKEDSSKSAVPKAFVQYLLNKSEQNLWNGWG